MAETTIVGKVLDGMQDRDAIHVAVASVKSEEKLYPGQHIGLAMQGNTEIVSAKGPHTGIVDPFLTHAVEPGTHFWMFLYPQTITSLKHNWTHPAFSVEQVKSTTDRKAASEAWLRDFCSTADCPGYDATIAAAIGEDGRQWDGEYLHFDGSDAHGEIPAEFWDHVEIVTGRQIKQRAKYFSCSC